MGRLFIFFFINTSISFLYKNELKVCEYILPLTMYLKIIKIFFINMNISLFCSYKNELKFFYNIQLETVLSRFEHRHLFYDLAILFGWNKEWIVEHTNDLRSDVTFSASMRLTMMQVSTNCLLVLSYSVESCTKHDWTPLFRHLWYSQLVR